MLLLSWDSQQPRYCSPPSPGKGKLHITKEKNPTKQFQSTCATQWSLTKKKNKEKKKKVAILFQNPILSQYCELSLTPRQDATIRGRLWFFLYIEVVIVPLLIKKKPNKTKPKKPSQFRQYFHNQVCLTSPKHILDVESQAAHHNILTTATASFLRNQHRIGQALHNSSIS